MDRWMNVPNIWSKKENFPLQFVCVFFCFGGANFLLQNFDLKKINKGITLLLLLLLLLFANCVVYLGVGEGEFPLHYY